MCMGFCAKVLVYVEHILFIFVVKTEPMSSSEIATTTTDGTLDSFSGSGKE